MQRQLRITCYFLLITFSFSCTPETPQSVRSPYQTIFYIYRFDPPALLEFSEEFQVIDEVPFSLPPNCGLFNTFPAPVGKFMAIELSCPNGQMVLLLDTDTFSIIQPIRDSDGHFLSWAPGGKSIYLKADSFGTPHVARVYTDGAIDLIPISEFTYDLASSANNREFLFTFSSGLGQGSELWLAKDDGRIAQQLYADQFNYISFARYSPDGTQIAFIKIPDTGTPFTVGELWVMDKDGSNIRKLADVDAGHGYAANWSPDGKKIAFVVRENPEDERANQSSEALISNIYVVEVDSRKLNPITNFIEARVETPAWSPDGNTLAFNVVLNDRMEVQIADLTTGEIRSLSAESTCCPAWIQK